MQWIFQTQNAINFMLKKNMVRAIYRPYMFYTIAILYNSKAIKIMSIFCCCNENTCFLFLCVIWICTKTIYHSHDADTFIGFFHDLCDKNINFIPSNIERKKNPLVNNIMKTDKKILIAIMHFKKKTDWPSNIRCIIRN